MEPTLLILIFLFSTIVTALIRNIALRKKFLDVPNRRSSHIKPTARSGGIAIVIACTIIFLLVFYGYMRVGTNIKDSIIGIAIALILVASIGLADDIRHIPAKWRILVHLFTATFALVLIHRLPTIDFFQYSIDLNLYWLPVLVLYLVWMINLYNFMDGIDGLAASEFIFVFSGAVIISLLNGSSENVFFLILCISSVAGFLIWNWPIAKIFLGDVGSGFLGLLTGLLFLVLPSEPIMPIWSYFILFGVFWVDSFYTLMRRMISKKKIYEAHRSHTYQILARRFDSHLKVVLSIQAINILWLLPIAYVASKFPESGAFLFFIAIFPLTLVAITMKAGINND